MSNNSTVYYHGGFNGSIMLGFRINCGGGGALARFEDLESSELRIERMHLYRIGYGFTLL